MTTTKEVINLTPHPVTIRDMNGGETTYPPAETPARVSTKPTSTEKREGLPFPVAPYPTYEEVTGLPGKTTGTIYIVSLIVLARCFGRTDVFAPGTGPGDEAVRDEKGQITAVTRLIEAPPHRYHHC